MSKAILFFVSFLLVFVLNAQNEVNLSLPKLFLNTDSEDINPDYKVNAFLSIDNDNDFNVGVEYRGSSSLGFPKKSLDFELRDENGSALNRSLLGMPKENDWILYAPYSDKTLIRNVLIYELARQSGFYAPRTRFCELYINEDYQGVYVLTEKIKRDKNRVDVSKLDSLNVEANVISGGYIFKADRKGNDSYWYSNTSDVGYQIVYPKDQNISSPQYSYIKKYVSGFETLLFRDNDTYLEYRDHINLDSFVDYFLFSEFSKNIDSYRLSTYFSKDRNSIDSLLYAGPLWDFNFAFGNANYLGGNTTDSILAYRYPMWNKMLSDAMFVDKSQERWMELRRSSLSDDRINFVIDSLVSQMGSGIENNFYKWDILGTYIVPNSFIGDTHEEEIIFLKSYVFNRAVWLDKHFNFELSVDRQIVNSFEVFPNPFVDELNVSGSIMIPGDLELLLFNSVGQKIQLTGDEFLFSGDDFILKTSLKNAVGVDNDLFFLILKNSNAILFKTVILRKPK